jgi:hypothetical protein
MFTLTRKGAGSANVTPDQAMAIEQRRAQAPRGHGRRAADPRHPKRYGRPVPSEWGQHLGEEIEMAGWEESIDLLLSSGEEETIYRGHRCFEWQLQSTLEHDGNPAVIPAQPRRFSRRRRPAERSHG